MREDLQADLGSWVSWDESLPLGFYWAWQETGPDPYAVALCVRTKGESGRVLRTLDGVTIGLPRGGLYLQPWLSKKAPASPEVEPPLGEWSSRPWRGGLHRVICEKGGGWDVYVEVKPGLPWPEWGMNTIVFGHPGLAPFTSKPRRWCRYVVPEPR